MQKRAVLNQKILPDDNFRLACGYSDDTYV